MRGSLFCWGEGSKLEGNGWFVEGKDQALRGTGDLLRGAVGLLRGRIKPWGEWRICWGECLNLEKGRGWCWVRGYLMWYIYWIGSVCYYIVIYCEYLWSTSFKLINIEEEGFMELIYLWIGKSKEKKARNGRIHRKSLLIVLALYLISILIFEVYFFQKIFY